MAYILYKNASRNQMEVFRLPKEKRTWLLPMDISWTSKFEYKANTISYQGENHEYIFSSEFTFCRLAPESHQWKR